MLKKGDPPLINSAENLFHMDIMESRPLSLSMGSTRVTIDQKPTSKNIQSLAKRELGNSPEDRCLQ